MSGPTIDILSLLPHRGFMLRLDSLLSVGDGYATGRYLVRADDPFLEDGQLSAEWWIETAAQTVAAGQGWLAQQAGRATPRGMLIGLSELCVGYEAPVCPGDVLFVSAERDIQKGSLVICRCALEVLPASLGTAQDRVSLAKGVLKFYVPVE